MFKEFRSPENTEKLLFTRLSRDYPEITENVDCRFVMIFLKHYTSNGISKRILRKFTCGVSFFFFLASIDLHVAFLAV